MMDSWKHAAEILNAHFHAICHGDIPLNMNWEKEAQQAADLDTQSLDFLAALKILAYSKGVRLYHKLRLPADRATPVEELRKRAKESPHIPLVWISALFLGSDRT